MSGASNARRAALTAMSTSAASASATIVSFSSVEGSIVSKVLFDMASTHSPSISSRFGPALIHAIAFWTPGAMVGIVGDTDFAALRHVVSSVGFRTRISANRRIVLPSSQRKRGATRCRGPRELFQLLRKGVWVRTRSLTLLRVPEHRRRARLGIDFHAHCCRRGHMSASNTESGLNSLERAPQVSRDPTEAHSIRLVTLRNTSCRACQELGTSLAITVPTQSAPRRVRYARRQHKLGRA